MPLVARLPANHSVHAFRAAAGLRYREAQRLVIAGDRLAAIYLAGYAGEMLLKAAFFRLTGWTPYQAISVSDLNNAKSYAKAHHKLAWPGNLHELPRWCELLIEERKLQGIPYVPLFTRIFNARVKRIYLNWRENLRYHTNRPFQGEVTVVLQAVRWILGQYRHL